MASRITIGILGGGVIGLSIAYQLAKTRGPRNEQIRVYSADLPGQSSWAGAGILPPAAAVASTDPLENLQRLSLEQMPIWSRELRELTGIDNEYQRCGGFYLALSAGEQAALTGLQGFWESVGIDCQSLQPEDLAAAQPWWAPQLPWQQLRAVTRVPGEAQLRNPRHLKALQAACDRLGVQRIPLTAGQTEQAQLDPSRMELTVENQEPWSADWWVIAAGSWTTPLLRTWFGDDLAVGNVFPVKGEMLLYRAPQPVFDAILNVGTRYFVPRLDGHVLVGSTEVETGFDAGVTSQGRGQLEAFVAQVLPQLAEFPLVGQWAGLRPASYDHMPLIGPLPRLPNVLVASGHFRSGIQWSIGTAICLAALLRGETAPIDLHVFRPGR